jgi:hypothetical protein
MLFAGSASTGDEHVVVCPAYRGNTIERDA